MRLIRHALLLVRGGVIISREKRVLRDLLLVVKDLGEVGLRLFLVSLIAFGTADEIVAHCGCLNLLVLHLF